MRPFLMTAALLVAGIIPPAPEELSWLHQEVYHE